MVAYVIDHVVLANIAWYIQDVKQTSNFWERG
jgi:hypothetical protein